MSEADPLTRERLADMQRQATREITDLTKPAQPAEPTPTFNLGNVLGATAPPQQPQRLRTDRNGKPLPWSFGIVHVDPEAYNRTLSKFQPKETL